MKEVNRLRDRIILGRKQDLHWGGVAFAKHGAFARACPLIHSMGQHESA